MPKELTYILGAGASYQSIPVVKTFAERFGKFSSMLKGCSDRRFNMDATEIELNNFKEAHEVANIFYSNFRSHQSFDTYFKKLFHTNQEKVIHLGKKILNLYFLWEHLQITESKPENDLNFWKQSVSDKRYDALIAGLLQPTKNKTELFCKINFITWNYDLNLFESIKQYYYPNITFSEFMDKIKTDNQFEWNIDNQITVINMNGYFYSSRFDKWEYIKRVDQKEVIAEKISNDYFNNSIIDGDAELVNFAWESKNNAAKIAAPRISSSKNIIIIGYTFPLYNRLQDYKYFNKETLSNKKLHIQDPDADNITESLKDNFNIILNSDRVKSITNCDSFFVPSDIIDEAFFNENGPIVW